MPALSPMMVSILEGCLRAGATCAVISAAARTVSLVRGDAPIGQGALPAGTFGPLTAELRALGAREGARSKVSVHSPIGPLDLHVEMDPAELRLFFPHDSGQAEAEAAFNALMDQVASLDADRVVCARGQASFHRGAELVAVAPLTTQAAALLVAHGHTFVPKGQQSGGGVLLSTRGKPRMLDVQLSDAGVVFSLQS
jgi:hypothetical protein